MLTLNEIDACMDKAFMNVALAVGPDNMVKTMKILELDDNIPKLIHTLSIEIAFAATLKGIGLANKGISISTVPKDQPVLVHDVEKEALGIVTPKSDGKFYLVGSNTEVDIKPSLWYDIDFFDSPELKEKLKEVTEKTEKARKTDGIQNV